MKPSVLIKSDPFFSDHEVGWLIRNNITRWTDFAKFSVNEIFDWTISDGSNRGRLYFCDKILIGCREREIELRFDRAFEMLSRNVRQKLAEFGVSDIVALAHLSHDELRKLIRNGGSRQDCIVILDMVGLRPRPELSDLYLKADEVAIRLKAGQKLEFIRLDLGYSQMKFEKIIKAVENFYEEKQFNDARVRDWRASIEAFIAKEGEASRRTL